MMDQLEQNVVLYNKANWKTVRLADVCEIDPSKRELNGIVKGTEVSFGMMADLGEHSRKFEPKEIKTISELSKGGYSYFKENDILLAKMTPCFENGKSGIALNLLNGIGFGSTEFFVLRSKEYVMPDWIYYIISSDKFINQGKYSMVGTTGRRRLMKQFVENFHIPLPPIEDQTIICDTFRSIEIAIEDIEKQLSNLQKLKHQFLKTLFSNTSLGSLLREADFEERQFGSIALNISERVEPKETSLNTYVGLEHLVPEDLTIQKTGTPSDVIGTKLKIYKGDIIFGKRRAYQRKIAVSHFDGIASAHSMILRPKQENIESDFLPYFMQSDVFMERAVQISEGSLSPTIKWKTLAQQRFTIPKKDKQQVLITFFKQFDETISLCKEQRNTLQNLMSKLLHEILE